VKARLQEDRSMGAWEETVEVLSKARIDAIRCGYELRDRVVPGQKVAAGTTPRGGDNSKCFC